MPLDTRNSLMQFDAIIDIDRRVKNIEKTLWTIAKQLNDISELMKNKPGLLVSNDRVVLYQANEPVATFDNDIAARVTIVPLSKKDENTDASEEQSNDD